MKFAEWWNDAAQLELHRTIGEIEAFTIWNAARQAALQEAANVEEHVRIWHIVGEESLQELVYTLAPGAAEDAK